MSETTKKSSITLTTFHAYEWEDLLNVFPGDFPAHANECVGASNKVSFGDAEWTLIEGSIALSILIDAWYSWDENENHEIEPIQELLPDLNGALVALRG